MTIAFERREHTALCFHVLAHLDLGRDAASLYDDTLPERPWAPSLSAAYRESPRRLDIHALPLVTADHDELVTALNNHADLGRELIAAMAQEREAFHHPWQEDTFGGANLLQSAALITGQLTVLRDALWERQERPAPPLVVLDCPALGSRARGARRGDVHVVATSLAQPPEPLLLQIFHEETHPITDPIVLRGHDGTARDTRHGSDGRALHDAIEHAALEVGHAIIAARLPELADAYSRWRSRFA